MPPPSAVRALSAAEETKVRRIRARVIRDWKAGKYATAAEAVAAIKKQTAHLGRPIPPQTIARAIRSHGHLGLRALNVAATWTLARQSAPRRRSPAPKRPSARRAGVQRRARSPGRCTGGDEPPPPPGSLADELAATLAESGPLPATTLARTLRRRNEDVYTALHGDVRFRQVGKRRASRWILVEACSFDTREAAGRWGCSPQVAGEIIFGSEGFLERGYVSSLNGNGRVVVTARGLEFAALVGSLASEVSG